MNKLAVGPIRLQVLSDPVFEHAHRAPLRMQLAVAEPVFEPDGPVGGVLGPVQQAVEQVILDRCK